MTARIGVVVIGRNEGERLRRCLESVADWPVTYVDSGSSDGSVALARRMRVEVVELDRSCRFTAALARNEGVAHHRVVWPEVEFVQFVDGDCQIVPGWIETAAAFLETHQDYAVACGRRREIYPEKSIYNRLCDMEWNTPVGDAQYCGGDAMMRMEYLSRVGGFNADVIAGEEPELCVRLRQAGWKIHRLERDMVLHDAAMARFGQWWRRSVRSGYAYALGAFLHGKLPERHWVREMRSNWFWGLGVPLLAIALAWPTHGWALACLAAYGVLFWRICRNMRSRRFSTNDALLYSGFCVLSKFSGVVGQCRFWWDKLRSEPSRIIEYKGVDQTISASARGEGR